MLNLKKYSHFVLLAVLAVFVASCEKRDESLMTDFESKKASADKLVTEVNEGLTKMDAEHAGMMRDLDSAGRASKDSSKVNGIREDMNRHVEQVTKVKALVDSVKTYTAVTAENDEQLRAANDRLGTHFDDLSNEWKTLQDQHAKLTQDIQGFAVNAAGQAVVDSAKAASTVKNNTPAKPSTTTPSRTAPTNNTPGKPRNTGSTSTTTTTTTTERTAPAKNTGGKPRNTGGSATTK